MWSQDSNPVSSQAPLFPRPSRLSQSPTACSNRNARGTPFTACSALSYMLRIADGLVGVDERKSSTCRQRYETRTCSYSSRDERTFIAREQTVQGRTERFGNGFWKEISFSGVRRNSSAQGIQSEFGQQLSSSFSKGAYY